MEYLNVGLEPEIVLRLGNDSLLISVEVIRQRRN